MGWAVGPEETHGREHQADGRGRTQARIPQFVLRFHGKGGFVLSEFRTDYSLAGPGMAASFKVYVVLTTENEAGSEEVSVERPD